MKLPVSIKAPSHGDAHRIDDPQLSFRGAAQAPVVFEGHHHAALFGFGDALLDASMHHLKPSSSVQPGMIGSMPRAFIRSSKSLMVFQRPELRRMQGCRVHKRFRGILGVQDVVAALSRVLLDEVLVNRHTHQLDPVAERVRRSLRR